MERREVLKSIIALGAGAVAVGATGVTATPTDSLPIPVSTSQSLPALVGGGSGRGRSRDHRKEWLSEIRKFQRNIVKAQLGTATCGISIPFATLPMNFYMRTPQALIDNKVPPPDLKTLRNLVSSYGGQWDMQYIISELWKDMFPAKRWELVEDVTLRGKGMKKCLKERIASSRYTIDLEELDDYKMGLFCLLPVVDILTEMHLKMQAAWSVMNDSYVKQTPTQVVTAPLGTLPMNFYGRASDRNKKTVLHGFLGGPRERLQCKAPEVWATKNAYMWEFFVHTVASGVIATHFEG